MTIDTRLEKLLTIHAATLGRCRNQLAMNFDTPSRYIIGDFCAETGLSRKVYDAMQSYRIAKDEAAQEAAWLAKQASTEESDLEMLRRQR